MHSRKPIFSLEDLAVLWCVADRDRLRENIKYYLRRRKLKKLVRGLYSIDEAYTELEVAQKLIPLSYISLHTALGLHGINFQYYSTIHSAAVISKRIKVKDTYFEYHQFKEQIVYNTLGVEKKDGYFLASPERAVCDTRYLWPNFYFDHSDSLNTDMLAEVAKIYKNKRLESEVRDLINDIKDK